jgi:hypothetical protein
MMKTPAAGLLFRRLAEGQASGEAVKELLEVANKAIEREKGQSK